MLAFFCCYPVVVFARVLFPQLVITRLVVARHLDGSRIVW